MGRFRTFADFLAGHFPGVKMQKISVNAGFSCPNRDGTLGTGGCTYCCNASFTPPYCDPAAPVGVQLQQGKEFFGRKYPRMRFLAYFQSYTSTHGRDTAALLSLYREACSIDGIDGVIIGTRPDCMPDSLLQGLRDLPWAMVEYGAESSHDSTLALVNRRHTWAQTADAVERTHAAGLPVGLHLINGLPGEDENMILSTVDAVNRLSVDVVKFHQLQLLRSTPLSRQVAQGECRVMELTPQSYARLCARIASRLRPDIAIDRFVSQAPPHMLISPRWGLKNHEFNHLVERELDSPHRLL